MYFEDSIWGDLVVNSWRKTVFKKLSLKPWMSMNLSPNSSSFRWLTLNSKLINRFCLFGLCSSKKESFSLYRIGCSLVLSLPRIGFWSNLVKYLTKKEDIIEKFTLYCDLISLWLPSVEYCIKPLKREFLSSALKKLGFSITNNRKVYSTNS